MGVPIRVLIVEDSEADAKLLIHELKRGGYEPACERVETSEAMTAALEKQVWDVITCDYNMPQFSAQAALTLLQKSSLDLPFIIVSGAIGEDAAVEAMKSGAHDYIMKGNMARLAPAIEREQREAEIRRAHRKAEELIQRMAFFDSLTDLPNRNLLMDRLLSAIRTDGGRGKPAALLLMDLDRFKEINDTLGHEQGDRLIQQVGQKLREAVFERDVVARLGGDEFAVLVLNMANAKDVDQVVQKIMETLDTTFLIDEVPIRIEAAFGFALYPEHGTDAATLFRRADIAMHVSKESGIPSTVFNPALDKHNPQRLALMGELRHAIEQDQLRLFYQPKIDMNTRRIMGAEALVRWKHPSRGMIPPDQFILPAEQTGLIHPLTRWVLGTAMAQCKDWNRAGLPLKVSVNLAARNLTDPKLPDWVAGHLRSGEVDADWMRFEITESAIMTNPALALDVLTRIRDKGIPFSIDDFGTGYSSLTYLKKFPVDTIKIDKSFILNMDKDPFDSEIVRSTIDLAHTLGLKAVAEGVENERVWDRLSEMGCDSAQGYYMCKPLPADELKPWLSESPWGINRSS